VRPALFPEDVPVPTQAEKAQAFRALHGRPGAFVIPNPWDVGSARILHALGFEALATTSAGYAFSQGLHDGEGLVGREEVLAHCKQLVAATPLPVSADLENGFGHSPDVVAETVRRAAAAGLAGCSVEDATGDESRAIYGFGHAVERVAAAVEAARSLPFPFTLTARAENFLHRRPDLDDTLKRLQAFAEAGADVLYAPGLPGLDAVKAVVAAVAPKPVNVLAGGKGSPLTVANLSALGVKRISVGGALYRAAMGEFLRAARETREKGTFTWGTAAASHAELTAYMVGK
jgi:2-methylisocitrate lyase-like PEP mutase family enzyme